MSQTALAGPHQAPNACLLIDFDNVTLGIRSDLQTELKNLLSSDIVKGKVAVQRAYADWRRYPQYVVPLTESSIDLIFATAYGSAKKNATDIRLAIDAIELVFTRPEIGTFILLSGDSDFSSLVIKLKEYGKYVIGVGIRESSSDLLVQNCDEYYSYNALAGLVKSGEEEVVKRDPWELVTEAITRMKRNGDVMRADRLKQVMQQIDSSFDEKNLGMSKFSRFVSEAAHRGLLTLTETRERTIRGRSTACRRRPDIGRACRRVSRSKNCVSRRGDRDQRSPATQSQRWQRPRPRPRRPRTRTPSIHALNTHTPNRNQRRQPTRHPPPRPRQTEMGSGRAAYGSRARTPSTSSGALLARTVPREQARSELRRERFSDATARA